MASGGHGEKGCTLLMGSYKRSPPKTRENRALLEVYGFIPMCIKVGWSLMEILGLCIRGHQTRPNTRQLGRSMVGQFRLSRTLMGKSMKKGMSKSLYNPERGPCVCDILQFYAPQRKFENF